MKIWFIGLNIGRLIFRLKFRWYDFWVGFYYDQKLGILYCILIPTLVLEIQILPKFVFMDFAQVELRVIKEDHVLK